MLHVVKLEILVPQCPGGLALGQAVVDGVRGGAASRAAGLDVVPDSVKSLMTPKGLRPKGPEDGLIAMTSVASQSLPHLRGVELPCQAQGARRGAAEHASPANLQVIRHHAWGRVRENELNPRIRFEDKGLHELPAHAC